MTPKNIIITVSAIVAVVVLAAVAWLLFTKDGEDAPEATGATATAAPVDPSGPAAKLPAKEGVTLGDYEPLVMPEGVAGGGRKLPQEALTLPETPLTAGDRAVTAPGNLSGPRPFMIVEVDSISEMLQGAELTKAYERASFPQEMGRLAQRVELRVRVVAGDGEIGDMNLAERILPVNGRMQGMSHSWTGEEGCADPSKPFAGIDDDKLFDTTVKVCFYAYGTIDAPHSMISNLELTTSYAHETQSLYVQSDKVRNPDYAELENEDEWSSAY